MREEMRNIKLEGALYKAKLLFIEETDRPKLRQLFDLWKDFSLGMQDFRSRGVNLPEGISESAFCLEFGVPRVLDVQGSSSSFDTFDLKTNTRQQIKATSVEDDLTSFGPKSVWDELFWLDFYRGGLLDGRFEVYEIPNPLIYNFQISDTQTFTDMQNQGKRPRLHMRRRIITPNNLQPLRICRI